MTDTKDQQIATMAIEKPKGRPKGSKDSKAVKALKKQNKILELAAKNISPYEISCVAGVPESTVRYTIKKYANVFKELENVEDYRAIKSDILDAAQLAVLKSGLTDDKLRKASLVSSMQAFEILNKANRLEKGLSTDNHGVSGFIKVNLSTKPEPE